MKQEGRARVVCREGEMCRGAGDRGTVLSVMAAKLGTEYPPGPAATGPGAFAFLGVANLTRPRVHRAEMRGAVD